MVAISKDEKDYICKHFPNVHIVRTMKQKSKRHHYYCEEARGVMNYLNKSRGYSSIDNAGKGGKYQFRADGGRVPA